MRDLLKELQDAEAASAAARAELEKSSRRRAYDDVRRAITILAGVRETLKLELSRMKFIDR